MYYFKLYLLMSFALISLAGATCSSLEEFYAKVAISFVVSAIVLGWISNRKVRKHNMRHYNKEDITIPLVRF